MNWVAVKGSKVVPVHFTHYWPGRWWMALTTPLPDHIGRKVEQLKTRYATYARVPVDGCVEVTAATYCGKQDMPQRGEGRLEVLKKLQNTLMTLGWKLQRYEDGLYLYQVLNQRDDIAAAKKRKAERAKKKAREEGLKRQPAVRAERARRRADLAMKEAKKDEDVEEAKRLVALAEILEAALAEGG